jgi:hypothetical protein
MNWKNKNTFNRYVYLWDIHWNKLILDEIDKYNDWKTLFIVLWDLFDRWNYSFEVFIKIKELFELWILKWILWNHDLFFIFSQLKNNSIDTYKNQLNLNKWKNTIQSFRKNVQYKNLYKHNNIWLFNIEVSQWLLENFDLYYIDPLNNISIHGWIPIFYDWNIVGDYFDNKEFLYWIDYIKELNNLLKSRDSNTISKFTAIYNSKWIIENNNKYYDSFYKDKWDDYAMFLPTWYRSINYIDNNDILLSIKKELTNHNLNKLIVWHDYSDENTNNINDIIYRVDMRHWILIKDNQNIVINFYKI